MGRVIGGMTISLDGFINDKDGSVGLLYPDLQELGASDLFQEYARTVGAVVMGRESYEMANGDFTGYEFQVPLFIVTHEAPEKVFAGENDKLTFTFVTDGVESAIQQAKAAAGDKNVMIVGGASITQQALNAGLVDDLDIGIMPVLLCAGTRLLDNLGDKPVTLEKVRVVESPGGRTDMLFRIVK